VESRLPLVLGQIPAPGCCRLVVHLGGVVEGLGGPVQGARER